MRDGFIGWVTPDGFYGHGVIDPHTDGMGRDVIDPILYILTTELYEFCLKIRIRYFYGMTKVISLHNFEKER